MRRILTLLVIATMAVTTGNAQSSSKRQANRPVNVIKQFERIINLYAVKNGETYSMKKHPDTNIIELSERVTNFSISDANDNLNVVRKAFQTDEPTCYQNTHIQPGSNDLISLTVISENDKTSKTVRIRRNRQEEMLMMCCKNAENPRMRDAYAIVWEHHGDTINGTIFQITSLRPDLVGNMIDALRSTFRIEGRVDENIKDSLYNIYIADSYEELNRVADDDYVACVPVVNKRFEYSVELDKPKVGRLRCIFPDGSLCSAWIDLDFVPGETYHITVHNGYYDDDFDYERRVGRNSGKSLITPYRNRIRDVREDDVVITDTADVIPPERKGPSFIWFESLPAAKRVELEAISEQIEASMKIIEQYKKKIGEIMMPEHIGTADTKKKEADKWFIQIYNLHSNQDKKIKKLIRFLADTACPTQDRFNMIKSYIEYLNKEAKELNAFNLSEHSLKNSIKCGKLLTKLSGEYLKIASQWK